MCESMSLNTKQITRCTLRFYDPEFVKNLNALYKKVGGTQSSFLGMLIKEGYKVVSPLYESNEEPVSESVLGVLGDKLGKSLDELKDILIEKSDAEMKGILALSDENIDLLRFLSCIYNLFVLVAINDKEVKDIAEQGGLDRIPKRFRKACNVRK